MNCVAVLLAIVAVTAVSANVGRIYGDHLHPNPYKNGYQSIGVAAFQDADEDGIPDLQDGDLNNDGIMDRTVKNDAYLNSLYGRRVAAAPAVVHVPVRTRRVHAGVVRTRRVHPTHPGVIRDAVHAFRAANQVTLPVRTHTGLQPYWLNYLKSY